MFQCVSPRTQVQSRSEILPKGKESIMGTYIRNLSITLIRQLHIQDADLLDGESGSSHGIQPARVLYAKRGYSIAGRLKKMRPETLGRIISFGKRTGHPPEKTSMCRVHCGVHVDRDGDGMSYLVMLATTVVVAEMTDFFQESWV